MVSGIDRRAIGNGAAERSSRSRSERHEPVAHATSAVGITVARLVIAIKIAPGAATKTAGDVIIHPGTATKAVGVVCCARALVGRGVRSTCDARRGVERV